MAVQESSQKRWEIEHVLELRVRKQRTRNYLRKNSDSLNNLTNDRFGSFAAVHDSTTRMAAIERIPVARLRFPGSPCLTVRFHQERSFKTLPNQQNDRPLSAMSGHGKPSLYVAANANDLAELRQLCIRIQGGGS